MSNCKSIVFLLILAAFLGGSTYGQGVKYTVFQDTMGQLHLCNNLILNNVSDSVTNVASVLSTNIMGSSTAILVDNQSDYHILSSSVAVDAGDSACVGWNRGMRGEYRNQGTGVDVGAFELRGAVQGDAYERPEMFSAVLQDVTGQLHLCNNLILNNVSDSVTNVTSVSSTNILGSSTAIFVDNQSDYNIRPFAIAEDAGDSACVGWNRGMCGEYRNQGAGVDVGAFELRGTVQGDTYERPEMFSAVLQDVTGQLHLCNNLILNNVSDSVTNVASVSSTNILGSSTAIFVDNQSDYHILSSSVAVDAGDSACVGWSKGMRGEYRNQGAGVDVGAFELRAVASGGDYVYAGTFAVLQCDSGVLQLHNNIIINNRGTASNLNIVPESSNFVQDGDNTFISENDYRLYDGSVCVNTGDNAVVVDAFDLNGNERVKQSIVDLGCFESDYNYVYPVEDGQPCQNANDVTDYDGTVYNTVQIGRQCWMKENLRVTHYSDGTDIPLGGGSSQTIAYRYYPNNNAENVTNYGYLYNWSAVMRGEGSSLWNPSGVQGVCPDGWHVPSVAEWDQLLQYVSSVEGYWCGDDTNAIAKALSSVTGWHTQNSDCAVGNLQERNNKTGFDAKPAGNFYGPYDNLNEAAFFWTSSEKAETPVNHNVASSMYPVYYVWNKCCPNVSTYTEYANQAFSVRCVLDEDEQVVNVLVNSNNLAYGHCEGTGSYSIGDTVAISATPDQYARFVRWSDNDTLNPRHVVVEKDTAFEAIFELYLPELHIASITHSDFIGGETAVVTWTVRNDGTASTPNGEVWYDRVWLSLEPRVGAGESGMIFLGEFPNVSALAPGEFYTSTQSFDIPLTLSGNYYLFVISDAYDAHTIYWENGLIPNPYTPPVYIGALGRICYGSHCGNKVFEMSEFDHSNTYHDNFFFERLEVTMASIPDLIVSSISPTTQNFFSGTEVNISYQVENRGNYDTRVTNWTDVVLVSDSPAFGETARVLKTISHNGLLLPDSFYQVSTTVSVPLEMYGTAWFYVYTDYYDQVYEHVGRYNNVARSDSVNIILTPPADLIPRNITAYNTVSSSADFHFSYEIHNEGAGAPNHNAWRDRCYLSTNPDSLVNAIQIADDWHYNGLASGEFYTVTHSVGLPSYLTQGTYYLFVQTDVQNDVFEYIYEDNNWSRFVQPIVVSQPDLQVFSLEVEDTLYAGAETSLSYLLANTGEGAVVNRNITDGLYISQYTNGSNATQLMSLPHNLWLNAHDSTVNMQNVLIPASVSEGVYFLFVKTNINDALNESETTNNSSPVKRVFIHYKPLPDLTITSIEMVNPLDAGEVTTIGVRLKNQGEAAVSNINLAYEIKVSSGLITIPCVPDQISPSVVNMAVGETIYVAMSIKIPPTITNNSAMFTVTVNPAHAVSESNFSNNSRSISREVRPYPFDLKTKELSSPETSMAGEYVNITWRVENISTVPSVLTPMYLRQGSAYHSVLGNSLPYPWFDKIYLSRDSLYDNLDVEIGSKPRQQVVSPDDSYTTSMNCRIPFNASGNYYILVVSDATQVTFDCQRSNNMRGTPVSITPCPLPDLRFDTLLVDNVLTSGETYTIRYSVSNQGENVTHNSHWTDALYINHSPNLDSAVQLGTRIHNGQLNVNAHYVDSVQVIIPNDWVGDSYLLGLTDATNQIAEMNDDDNNMKPILVSVSRALPCDLVVSQPGFPQSANVGDSIQVLWTLQNVGLNTAQGSIKEAVYLSTDSTWGSDDIMLGSVTFAVNLAADGQVQRAVTLPLHGVPAGDYYVVVRSNILNALNENSYTNNNVVSLTTMHVDYPSLYIDQEEHRQLNSGQSVYYKLEVGPEYEHQTLSCKLTAPTHNVSNGLYVAYSSAPSASNFDWSATVPYNQEQEVLIPSLEQGTYYIMATGQTIDNSSQNVTILASIINFEIISVNANSGANTGSVTTQIVGAKFDTIMDFRLANSNGYLPAEKVFFHNSTESYATFNLCDQETGVYDMVAELPGGIITVKGQAFVVESGLPAELLSNIVAPASVRNGNTFTVTIEYGNNGSTDLNISGFLLVSTNGFPIAFESDSLANNATELTFETAEPNGNPDVIRPGHFASKTIFVKANRVGNINLKLYPIRRQY